METGEPYPVRALIVEATNPLLTYADTHRVFNALMGLDLIVVLDHGRIVQRGTHESLLADPDGLYSKLVAMQSFV